MGERGRQNGRRGRQDASGNGGGGSVVRLERITVGEGGSVPPDPSRPATHGQPTLVAVRRRPSIAVAIRDLGFHEEVLYPPTQNTPALSSYFELMDKL